MRIGELATATGMSTKAIRYYEGIGLLPDPTREANGYRVYDPGSVDRIRFIKDAQTSGLSLAEVGMILDMKDQGESTCGHVIWLLDEHLASVDRQIEELTRTRARLEEMTARARSLDPADCRDPNRCQAISTTVELSSDSSAQRKEDMTQTTLNVPEIHCDHCKTSLEGAVGAVEGVDTVTVSVADATIDVSYDDSTVGLDVIKAAIEEQGYAVVG
jgi:copper ion binding protein